MEGAGIDSVAELARRAGLQTHGQYATLARLVALTESALHDPGARFGRPGDGLRWRPEAEAVAAALGCAPGDLFSQSILDRVPGEALTTGEIRVEAGDVAELLAGVHSATARAALPPDAVAEQAAFREYLDRW